MLYCYGAGLQGQTPDDAVELFGCFLGGRDVAMWKHAGRSLYGEMRTARAYAAGAASRRT
jgi:hypothetical protein